MRPSVDLNLLRAFVAVYEAESFSGAGAKLDLPRSTLSRAIAALEESLGVTLFQRTTRRVSHTRAATALYERVASKLALLDASFADLPDAEAEPSGTLRVTATTEFGAMVLAEAIARYTQRYSRVRIELKLTTAYVDLVKEKVDVGIRFAGKPLRDSTLVARKIGTIATHVYASPSYLARRGAPRTPAELAGHDWVEFAGSPPLRTDIGRGSKVAVNTRITADSLWCMREILKVGGGIGHLPSFLAAPEVAAGNLVHVLPRWVAMAGTVWFVHPASKHPSPRVTTFRDLLVEMLRQRPIGPS